MSSVDEITQAVTLLVRTPEEAHQELTRLWRDMLKPLTQQGREFQITVCEAEEDRTVAQNRFYWGVVLKEISEQAVIEGTRWAPNAWHNLFKRTFLGYRIRKEKVAGRKRTHVIRELRSTTDLKVRAWNTYLDKIMAMAVNDLHVQFSDPWWEKR